VIPQEYYVKQEYPFHAIADSDGGWVIEFPDLPGCLMQFDRIEAPPYTVEDVRRL